MWSLYTSRRKVRSSRRNAMRAFACVSTVFALTVNPTSRAQATGSHDERPVADGTVTTGTLMRVGVVDLTTASRATVTSHSERRAAPYPRRQQGHGSALPSTAAVAPEVRSAVTSAVPGSIVNNLSGLNSLDSQNVSGSPTEPPDQGLCVGPGGPLGTTSVLELVNSAVALYNSAGTFKAGPFNINAIFGEPTGASGTAAEFVSDPRCYYDPTAHAWFATVLAIDPNNTASHVDVLVNPNDNPVAPWTEYRFDTTANSHAGCPCFGDQPLLGVDDHGVYVTTNEFSILGSAFNGAQVYAISKKDLLAGAVSPFVAHFGKLTIPDGSPATSLQPAQNPHGSSVEYFLNSLDPNSTTDNRLGVWAMTNDNVLDTHVAPTLIHTIVQSEVYGQPPNATQPGSASPLSSGDDRMQQVQNVNGVLWSALDTVVHITGDAQNRAGVAWFKVTPSVSGTTVNATIAGQGYVAFFGHYLMYPAIAVNDAGNGVMALSASGSDLFPTAGYATGPTFQSLAPSAIGTQNDHGFTCTDPTGGNTCRWGDYAAAVRDFLTGNIWVGSEYIGGAGDLSSNWSTRLTEVSP